MKTISGSYIKDVRVRLNLLKFKEVAGILNSATAFMAMIEIVNEWIKAQEDTRSSG